MKKKILLLLLTVFLFVGCDALEDASREADEAERTYKGVVYDRVYHYHVSHPRDYSDYYVLFSESEKKVLEYHYTHSRRGNKGFIDLEGTYEGSFGDEIIITFIDVNKKEAKRKYSFQDGYDFTMYFVDRSYSLKGKEDVKTIIKEIKKEVGE